MFVQVSSPAPGRTMGREDSNLRVSSPAPGRTLGREDSALCGGCGLLWLGRMLVWFVVVDPDASVVPVSP